MAGKKGNTNKPIDKEAITETISLRFSKEELKQIEEIANELELAKTRFMRNLILTSLDEAKLLHKMGALKGAKKLLDFKERFLRPGKYKKLIEA